MPLRKSKDEGTLSVWIIHPATVVKIAREDASSRQMDFVKSSVTNASNAVMDIAHASSINRSGSISPRRQFQLKSGIKPCARSDPCSHYGSRQSSPIQSHQAQHRRHQSVHCQNENENNRRAIVRFLPYSGEVKRSKKTRDVFSQ